MPCIRCVIKTDLSGFRAPKGRIMFSAYSREAFVRIQSSLTVQSGLGFHNFRQEAPLARWRKRTLCAELRLAVRFTKLCAELTLAVRSIKLFSFFSEPSLPCQELPLRITS